MEDEEQSDMNVCAHGDVDADIAKCETEMEFLSISPSMSARRFIEICAQKIRDGLVESGILPVLYIVQHEGMSSDCQLFGTKEFSDKWQTDFCIDISARQNRISRASSCTHAHETHRNAILLKLNIGTFVDHFGVCRYPSIEDNSRISRAIECAKFALQNKAREESDFDMTFELFFDGAATCCLICSDPRGCEHIWDV